MSAADRCYECGRALSLVAADAVETARESIGFGAANDRTRTFCSARCRCRWLDVDPVIDATLQATVTAFDGGTFDPDDPDAVVWGC